MKDEIQIREADRCAGCYYGKPLTPKYNECKRVYFCDYLCMEHKMRPCEGGDLCTVYISKEERKVKPNSENNIWR